MKAKTYTEQLTHFQCAKCKGWWTIGDWYKIKVKFVYCPRCGEKQEVNGNE